jgi:membrane protease YdiL (CAAX protease family)
MNLQSSPDADLKIEEVKTKSNGAMKLNPWLAILAAAAWPAVGLLLAMVLGMIFKVKFSRLESALIGLPVGFLGALYIFPIVNQVPFGAVPLREYLRRIGFYLPANAWRHALLGVVLAGCTLTGMVVASLLTGRYVLDWSQINLGQIVFSLNPGFLEEIFYRGIVVMLLLPLTRSLTKALIGQIVIFGLAHIKSLDGWALFDVVSVMVLAIAFTYSAYKTRSLLAGIVFHFLHDALLFFVQVPGGSYQGWQENLIFYALLWLMVGVACFVIWYATERLHVRGESELYVLA